MYSFKTVLLDMITNQPVIDRSRIKSHITPSVGTELNGGYISKIMGPNLHVDYNFRYAWGALEDPADYMDRYLSRLMFSAI